MMRCAEAVLASSAMAKLPRAASVKEDIVVVLVVVDAMCSRDSLSSSFGVRA